MSERFLMYWLLWLIFIIIFFFMETGKKRTVFILWMLMIISFSFIYLNVSGTRVSVSMLFILIGAFIYLVEYSFSYLQLLRAFMIMLAYSVLLIWQLMAPVWFFLPNYLMIPLLIVCTAYFLCRNIENIYPFVLVGISLGQLLFDTLLYIYHLHDLIGTVHYFIHLSLSLLLLITIRTCFELWNYLTMERI